MITRIQDSSGRKDALPCLFSRANTSLNVRANKAGRRLSLYPELREAAAV